MHEVHGRELLVRADAGPRIGTGHMMRCLALGQAWSDGGGKVVFVTAPGGRALLRRLKDEGFEIHMVPDAHPSASDWEALEEMLSRYVGKWLVLDGYHFDEAYQRHVREMGLRLLVIDDTAHLKRYVADMILNQNAHARFLTYASEGGAKLLLGTEYVLIRREFREGGHRPSPAPKIASHILATFGGSDPLNITLRAIQALGQVRIPGLEVIITLGAQNPHGTDVEAAASSSDVDMDLRQDVTDMPELMAWADLALCSGGTSVWELAFMGVPSIVVATTPAERYLVNGLREVDLFQTIDDVGLLTARNLSKVIESKSRDQRWRARMVRRGTQVVDGAGCERVIHEMSQGGVSNH